MKTKERDFDNDPLYRTPTGWLRVKQALRHQYRLNELFAEMERLCTTSPVLCPRVMLAVALHHYIHGMTDEQRLDALCAQGEWQDHRLASERKQAIDAEFHAVMTKIFGDDPAAQEGGAA